MKRYDSVEQLERSLRRRATESFVFVNDSTYTHGVHAFLVQVSIRLIDLENDGQNKDFTFADEDNRNEN